MKDKLMILEMLIEAYKHDGESFEKLKPIREKLYVMWNECMDNMKKINTLTAQINNITLLECEKILTPLKSI